MEQVAQFRILNKIGAGGMGEVYRARDEKLQRDVAIKVLPAAHFEDATSRARLLREARSAAALNHPNICVIHEVGEADSQAFIAMECVEGEPLSARLARSPLTHSEAIKFGIQLADALAHAHEHGVVHRDLKPQNIIVTPQQRLKVLDFGLAKRIAEASDPGASTDVLVTAHGVISGTPAYMSPEQLRGKPADERSDIWAMGVILHEMVSGKRPFAGGTWPELSASILSLPAHPLPADVPPELQTIIQKCLAKEPDARYRSAAEVRSGLEIIQSTAGFSRPLPLPRRGRNWLLGGSAIAVIAIAITIGYNMKLNVDRAKAWSTPTTTPAASSKIVAFTPLASQRSVAVLPFSSYAGPDEEYFADGMQDAVIGELARLKELRVISRTSTLPFKDTKKSMSEISTALRADNIVEGSVARAGDRVRVQVKLIKTSPQEKEVWSESYERDMRDVLSLYSEISTAVASKIDAQLGSVAQAAMIQPVRKVDPEVYNLCLKARYFLNKYNDKDFQTALKFYREANDKDPTDPLPYAGLATAYATLAHSPSGSPEYLAFGRAAALKAIQLDPNQAEAHDSMAMFQLYQDWNWNGLEDHFKKALAVNPTLAELRRHYAWYLLLMLRSDEAIAEMKRARDSDPLSSVYYSDLAQHYMIAGRFDEGIEEAKKGLALDPNSGYVMWPLGEIYVRKGMTEEGLAIERKMAQVEPSMKWGFAVSLALAGKKTEALAIARELEKNPHAFDYFGIASIYAVLNDKDSAFLWMERGREKRVPWMPWCALNPAFASLRSDPRMKAFNESLKVPYVAPDYGKPSSVAIAARS